MTLTFLSLFVILFILFSVVALLYKRYEKVIQFVSLFFGFSKQLKKFLRHRQTTADLFEKRVIASPTRTALIFEGKTWTYMQMNQEANKVASWALSEGIRPKQIVALMMENRPEFIFTWLGLAKIGAATSLINTNLKGGSLIHAFNLCEAEVVIAGPECTNVIDELRPELQHASKYWVYGSSTPVPGWQDLTAHIKTSKDCDIQSSQRAGCNGADLLWYIYTSGTTGLPKAAKIKHARFFSAGHVFASFHRLNANDRIYCPLPLYHSAAAMIGIGSAWHVGASIVLRSKFSASNFFRDCYENKCTVIQYIGQICRYLMNTPQGEYDQLHMVRKAIGNGMQIEIWEAFQKRFNIPYIGEFYASTEGNAGVVNNHNKVGACGYMPKICELIYPIAVVAFDHEKEQPARNAKGFCTRVGDAQVGELLGLVLPNDPIRKFDGYTSEKANQDKLLRNVLKPGDCWFRTGDLLKRDSDGYFYFVDRIGDTFRWKGENVATSEVSAVVSNFPGFAEVNIYGVTVPHNEGRAGMASITLQSDIKSTSTSTFGDPKYYDSISIDWSALYQFLSSNLPSYQQPLFIRIQPEMSITTTFKHKKTELVIEGFNPEIVSDPIFFRDDTKKTFIPLTTELYQTLTDGKIRI